MNTKRYRPVPARFAPETRFEVHPLPAVPFRALQEDHFEILKNRLLSERLTETLDPLTYSGLRRAANDAAALAWSTAFPLLLFPALFEEKARHMLKHEQPQVQVRECSRELLAL